jgi:hypothetical protein
MEIIYTKKKERSKRKESLESYQSSSFIPELNILVRGEWRSLSKRSRDNALIVLSDITTGEITGNGNNIYKKERNAITDRKGSYNE